MPPKRAVGLAKTNKGKKAQDGPEAKKRRTDGEGGSEIQAETVQLASEDWGDLKELYARAKNAADEEGPIKGLPLLRGVLHECDRIIRNHPDPSQVILSEASSPANIFDPYSVHSSFHSLYANALLDIGIVIGKEPDFAIEGEPDSIEDYLSAAFEILQTSAVKYQTADLNDWAHNYGWMRGLLLLADIRGGKTLEPHGSASLEKQSITDLSAAELVEKAQKHFKTCSFLLSKLQKRNREDGAQLLEYPSFPAFVSIYAHLLLNVVDEVDSPEEQIKKAEEIGVILDLATQRLKEIPNVERCLSVESDIKKGTALIRRIQVEASISLVDDEDLNNPLVIAARADLEKCEKLLQEAKSLLDDAPGSYLVEMKKEEINEIIKDLWSYIYFITDDEAERKAIEDKAHKEGFVLGDGDEGGDSDR